MNRMPYPYYRLRGKMAGQSDSPGSFVLATAGCSQIDCSLMEKFVNCSQKNLTIET